MNEIKLSNEAYPDSEDGEQVETTVKGILSINDGVKTLRVTEADGQPVQQEMAMEMPEEGEVEEASGNLTDGIKKAMGEDEEE